MKQSAGLLLYRSRAGELEVLIVHPGGPFWAKKDAGAWSIPKGEFLEGEEPLAAAKREFREELGLAPPDTPYIDLGFAKIASGKVGYMWATQADLDIRTIHSNTTSMEWPPRSGRQQEFPEVDKAMWCTLDVARQKLVTGQVVFIERLAHELQLPTPTVDGPESQTADADQPQLPAAPQSTPIAQTPSDPDDFQQASLF